VIWGDSHAAHFYDGVARLDNNRPWLLLGHFSCPPTSETEVSDDAPDCTSVNNTMLSFINTNTSIKTVALVFFGNYIAQDNYAADHVARQGGLAQVEIKAPGMPMLNKTQSFEFGLRAAVASLRSSGKQVIIVVDVPELPFFPKRCLGRPFVSPNACLVSKGDVDRRQREFREVIYSIHKEYSDVAIFDPLDLICNGEFCTPIKDGISLYVDSHHLSQRGSEIVAREFLKSLASRVISRE
jgi:SGNH domain (fused to AT3 domains)